MRYIAVSKFPEHQHYKNRKPPWIKFYVKLLDVHHPMNELPVATRYLFDRLLLLAAEYNNAIPNDSELIASLLRMAPSECCEGLEQLQQGRWIKVTNTKRRASKAASKAASDFAPPETETEGETEPLPELHIVTPELKRGNGWVENLNDYTGCRYIRGTHASSAVYDVLGTEPTPRDWPHARPTRQEISDALTKAVVA